jgi:hypothetical protein
MLHPALSADGLQDPTPTLKSAALAMRGVPGISAGVIARSRSPVTWRETPARHPDSILLQWTMIPSRPLGSGATCQLNAPSAARSSSSSPHRDKPGTLRLHEASVQRALPEKNQYRHKLG